MNGPNSEWVRATEAPAFVLGEQEVVRDDAGDISAQDPEYDLGDDGGDM